MTNLKKLFNEWAGDYDSSIDPQDESYPFAGYYDVLAYTQSLINLETKPTILDLGVGTGLLTAKLAEQGARITGLDFSEAMLQQAREKMPQEEFILFDFSYGLPSSLQEKKFDYIVSAYAWHHLNYAKQGDFLLSFVKHNLVKNGLLIIADIAFATKEDQLECALKAGKYWDEEEHYFTKEEIIPLLTREGFTWHYKQISHCAGVLEVGKSDFRT